MTILIQMAMLNAIFFPSLEWPKWRMNYFDIQLCSSLIVNAINVNLQRIYSNQSLFERQLFGVEFGNEQNN